METGKGVYILTNKHRTTLYIGVTGDLVKRVMEHKSKKYPGSFTSKYNVFCLVYYERFTSMLKAIEREKQIKNYSRKKKEEIISAFNPGWVDLI